MRSLSVSLALFVLTSPAALAQSSASFTVESYVFDQGGRPQAGPPASAGFAVTLDSIGDGRPSPALFSPSFRLAAGFVAGHAPPVEVRDLVFLDAVSLDWSGQVAAVRYDLYRDVLASLGSSGGVCAQPDLPASGATDPGTPAPGTGWFYLATATNRLGEEGTRGESTGGSERPETGICP